jgi:hypothetical protein
MYQKRQSLKNSSVLFYFWLFKPPFLILNTWNTKNSWVWQLKIHQTVWSADFQPEETGISLPV